MHPLALFALVAAVSAVGSLQAGAVNVSVLRRALQGRRAEARALALGGSLPEAAYAALALGLGQWTQLSAALGPVLRWAFPIVLLGLGLYYLLRRSPTALPPESSARRRGAFATGLLLATANPQLLPFWLAVAVYLRDRAWLSGDGLGGLAFCLGAWAGAAALLFGVAWAGGRLHIAPTPARLRRLDQLTAGVLILLAALGFWALR